MAGAKQLGDTGFILVPGGVVRPAVMCPGHCIALHRGACRGTLQARWDRRWSLQVPEVWLRLSDNIVAKSESVAPPRRPGDCPSFYRSRRSQFTGVSYCFIYVWWCGVQCCGVDDRPGESCFWRDVMACPVSIQERLWGCGIGVFRSVVARVLTRGCGRREAVRSTAAGVAVSCRPALPQRRGWRCSARGSSS
jgi:hypothetical protein